MSPSADIGFTTADPEWRVDTHEIAVGEERFRFRLARFPAGWVASVDTVIGPTIGVDRSPYLAARLALEPLGIDLPEVIGIVGPLIPR